MTSACAGEGALALARAFLAGGGTVVASIAMALDDEEPEDEADEDDEEEDDDDDDEEATAAPGCARLAGTLPPPNSAINWARSASSFLYSAIIWSK